MKPTAGSLKKGTIQEFHLKAPGAQRMVVVTEAGLFTLPPGRLPGEFRGTVPMIPAP